MKAIVNIEHPLLAGIFDKGDEVEIEVFKTTHKFERHLNNIIGPNAEYAPVGDFKGYRVKGKNNQYYNEELFQNVFGYKITLADIFTKL